MDNIYLIDDCGPCAILAVADLVVGVSNDAVNFLELGNRLKSHFVQDQNDRGKSSVLLLGAIFSSGMMEVATKGNFQPRGILFQ